MESGILDDLNASLGKLKACRVELQSVYATKFATAHYISMSVLGAALLFIFLLQTDNGAVQFLIQFQLSICWALLIFAYSLLAAVILELRIGIPPGISTRLDQDAFLDHLLVSAQYNNKSSFDGQDGLF